LRVETADSTPRQLADLKPKMRLEGKVTKIEMFGVFVDVGLGQPGLVHISKIRNEPVNKIEDVVQQGQAVEVWVQRVDPVAGRLELTMIPPLLIEWKDLKPGLRLKGKVVRLEPFGAFVEIGAERPGLVHVSEMSDEYVRNVAEFAKVGDEIEVGVVDIDRKKRQIRLTMKLPEPTLAEADDEGEEAMITPMEHALRQAMAQGDSGGKGSPRSTGRPQRSRDAQEDIIARTLETRMKSSSGENRP
jgi:ribosomal protein S1